MKENITKEVFKGVKLHPGVVVTNLSQEVSYVVVKNLSQEVSYVVVKNLSQFHL